MEVSSSSSSPEQQTSEHYGITLMKPHYTNGATTSQSILSNIPEILINYLPSYPLLVNQMHPAPCNQGWILRKMARAHRENHLKYHPESDITAKGHLDQNTQLPEAAASANVTTLSTKERDNTNELLLHIFDLTEKHYSDLTGKFLVQSDRGNNYILAAYHYDANDILTTPLKNRTWTCILNGIKKFITN